MSPREHKHPLKNVHSPLRTERFGKLKRRQVVRCAVRRMWRHASVAVLKPLPTREFASRSCAFLPSMVGWAAHWTRAAWLDYVTSYNPGPILPILWSGARITCSQPSGAIVHPSTPSRATMARGTDAYGLDARDRRFDSGCAARFFRLKPVPWATSSNLKARRVFFSFSNHGGCSESCMVSIALLR